MFADEHHPVAGGPPPEVQTPDGNRASTNQNTESQIIDASSVDGKPVDRAEKELATCRAKLAMYAGLSLYELSDGTFLATNHRSTHPLRDRHAVAMLVRKLEGAIVIADRKQLEAAFGLERSPTWPQTLEEALRRPMYAALLRARAARLVKAARAVRSPVFDFKKAAAGDRDD